MTEFKIGDLVRWRSTGELATVIGFSSSNLDLIHLKWEKADAIGSYIGWHRKVYCIPVEEPNNLMKALV